MSGSRREPDVAGFALHNEEPVDPVLGRLVKRGLHYELRGSAYAIVDGIDGRTHHVRFADIEMTGDAVPGTIVEARTYEDLQGKKRVSLAVRPDLGVEARVMARGPIWIERQLIADNPEISNGGFGSTVREGMERLTIIS